MSDAAIPAKPVILPTPLPKLLYHYTDAAGLKGILTSKELWATDARFLNDSREIRLGWVYVDMHLKSIREDWEKKYPGIWKILDTVRITSDNIPYYIISFTEEGDLLSQWRGYNRGLGFSIGFDPNDINALSNAQDFRLTPVAYNTAEYHQVMGNLMTIFPSYLDKHKGNLEVAAIDWWQRLLTVVPILKDENFREEKENRTVWVRGRQATKVHVRTRQYNLIPYKPFMLETDVKPGAMTAPLGIREIIYGPGLALKQEIALKALLEFHGFAVGNKGTEVRINRSKIPYVAD